MKVIRGISPDVLAQSAVTLGMFDGVHRGHQGLLHSCRRQAEERGVPAVVLTYEPHPTQILRPEQPVRLLTPLEEKIARLADAGIDYAVIPEFTVEFSHLSPETFIREVIIDALHPSVIVAGYRTTFGHHRAGNADVLRAMGEQLGVTVKIVEPIEVAGGPVSSSRIRQCLDQGDIALANELLGYRYQLIGVVTHGDARGRTLGVPTANLDVPATKLVPLEGVYAVEVALAGSICRGVMHIGSRPTFDRPPALEVHLLDYQGDAYGQQMVVTLLRRLRDVRAFADAGALTRQIHQDITEARAS